MSGIVAVTAFACVTRHYVVYNFEAHVRTEVHHLTKQLAQLAEEMVYISLGVSLTLIDSSVDWTLFGLLILFCTLARGVSVWPLLAGIFICKICFLNYFF